MLLSVKKKSIHCIMKSKYLMTLYYPLCQYAVGVEKMMDWCSAACESLTDQRPLVLSYRSAPFNSLYSL